MSPVSPSCSSLVPRAAKRALGELNQSVHGDSDLDFYILFVFEEDAEVVVVPEDGVVGKSAQKDLVHGYCLLEGGQVFPDDDEQVI